MGQSGSSNVESYELGNCGILARAWVHKMQRYLNRETCTDSGSADDEAYAEPSDFSALAATARGAIVAARVLQI